MMCQGTDTPHPPDPLLPSVIAAIRRMHIMNASALMATRGAERALVRMDD